jgi:hypothetical protein
MLTPDPSSHERSSGMSIHAFVHLSLLVLFKRTTTRISGSAHVGVDVDDGLLSCDAQWLVPSIGETRCFRL